LSTAPDVAQTFGTVYSDANGYLDVNLAYLLVNTRVSGTYGIYAYYARSTARLYLMNDASSAAIGSCTPGEATTLSNSQGTLDCAGTTVSGDGTDLTITWRITPTSTFASAFKKNVYLQARDASNASTGWVDQGDWTIWVNQVPTLGTYSPAVLSSPAGTAQALSAVYSDANGATDLNTVYLLINSTLTGANSIYAYYTRATNRFYLLNDAASGPVGSCAQGEATTLSNSQGTLNCAALWISGPGNNLTITWNITPSATFASTTKKNVYLQARDFTNGVTGWVDKADWTVFTNVAPTLGTVSPSPLTSAAGTPQSLTAVYSDANGSGDVNLAYLMVNATLNGANAIYGYYARTTGRIYLLNDLGSAPVGNCTPGAATKLTNSQGSIDCAATTVTGVGNDLTVVWRVTPTGTFTGTKNVYLNVRDNASATTGWADKGDWTITP